MCWRTSRLGCGEHCTLAAVRDSHDSTSSATIVYLYLDYKIRTLILISYADTDCSHVVFSPLRCGSILARAVETEQLPSITLARASFSCTRVRTPYTGFWYGLVGVTEAGAQTKGGPRWEQE